jgi:hypothetical protein
MFILLLPKAIKLETFHWPPSKMLPCTKLGFFQGPPSIGTFHWPPSWGLPSPPSFSFFLKVQIWII